MTMPSDSPPAQEQSRRSIERQLAPLLQSLLVFMLVAIVGLLAINVLIGAVPLSLSLILPNAFIMGVLFASLLLVRRGHLSMGLWAIIGIVFFAESLILLTADLSVSDRTLINFIIPISLAGLFLGRPALFLTTTASAVIVWVSASLSHPALIGGLPVASTAIQYTIVAGIYAFLIDLFRGLFLRALETAYTQANALERMQIDNIKLYNEAETERERLQVTLSSIGDAVITTDTEARVTFMNGIASALTGWRADAATGKPLSEVFRIANEYTGEVVENPVERVLAEGVIVGLANHTVLLRPDNSTIPIADSGAPIRSGQGRILGAVLVFRDVSDDRAAQIALEESEMRFRTLADNAPVLIWMADPTGGCIYRNRSWLDFTGRALEDELGDGWLTAIHPDDDEAVSSAYRTAFDARQPFSMDYRLRRADGIYRWVVDRGAPRYSPDGTFVGYIGSGIDITERRQNERRTRLLQDVTARFSEALTQQQVAEVVMERVMALLGSHLGSMYAVSPDGSHLALLSMTGNTDEVRETYRILSFDSPGPLLEAIISREPIWIGNQADYVTRYPEFADIVRANGSHALACLPLIVNDKVVGGFTLSFREPQEFDADQREFIVAIARQCAQALERARLYEIETDARQQAEAANLLKLRFLAMISHELRTPLTSIKGFTSTLLAPDVDWEPETQREFLGILDEEADKLTELVEQLLDVSRLQAGNLTIEPDTQSFVHIVESAEAALRSLTSGFQLVLDLPENLPLVKADTRRIGQVLTNLVSNAVKYAPASSDITVAARALDDHVQVTVSDTGIGIPPHEREAVFEAFHQLRHRRSGAGLGLAICRGLVEAHGGKIWIVAQDTPGTTVAFTLPVAPPVEGASESAAAR